MAEPLHILPVWDDDVLHAVELTDIDAEGHGIGRLLDHDEKTLKSFLAFDATPPLCYEVLQLWREEPLKALLVHGNPPLRRLLEVAMRWARKTLPFETGPAISPKLPILCLDMVDISLGEREAISNQSRKIFKCQRELEHQASQSWAMRETYPEREPKQGIAEDRDYAAYSAVRNVLSMAKWYMKWLESNRDPLLVNHPDREVKLKNLHDRTLWWGFTCGSYAARAHEEPPWPETTRQQVLDVVALVRKTHDDLLEGLHGRKWR